MASVQSRFLFYVLFSGCFLFNKTVAASIGNVDGILTKKTVEFATTKSRYKRGDCFDHRIFDSNCTCDHSLCSAESIHDAITTVCTASGQTCYLSNRQSASWSLNKSDNTFFSVQCQKEHCYDSYFGYTCTCQNGFEVLDSVTVTDKTPTQNSKLAVYLPATIVSVGLSLVIIMAVCISYRRYRRKKEQDIERQMTVKCDVLFVVDNKDELKRYSEQLMFALNTAKDIKMKRIDIFHLCNGKNRFKCDRTVFILHEEHKSLDLSFETAMSKIKFRKRQNTSVTIVHVVDKEHTRSQADDQQTFNGIPTEISQQDKTLCRVSEIKNLNEWVPCVLKLLFGIRLQSNLRSAGNTYFIKQRQDSGSTKMLSDMLDDILSSCGAVKLPSIDTAACKILIIEDFDKVGDDINATELQKFQIFSVLRSPSANYKIKTNKAYSREQFIAGVIQVLIKLQLIKCERPKRRKCDLQLAV